jgi:hypothetical protein
VTTCIIFIKFWSHFKWWIKSKTSICYTYSCSQYRVRHFSIDLSVEREWINPFQYLISKFQRNIWKGIVIFKVLNGMLFFLCLYISLSQAWSMKNNLFPHTLVLVWELFWEINFRNHTTRWWKTVLEINTISFLYHIKVQSFSHIKNLAFLYCQ